MSARYWYVPIALSRMVLLLCLSYSVWCDTFSLQQGLPSQVESDE
eukprot:COSAG01_NODE_66577_length_269_cov_1.605882_1_plen_44_part_01